MKMVKKDKCKFINGHIVKKGEVIGISRSVFLQLRKLETMVQQYGYLNGQPEFNPGPSLDGFKFKSALMSDLPYVEMPDTPVTDERVEQAMAFMNEADEVAKTEDINDMIDRFAALIDWCASDRFVEGPVVEPIDTYALGNPLALSADDIVAIITLIVGSPIVFGI